MEETDENILSLALGDHAIIEVGTYDPPNGANCTVKRGNVLVRSTAVSATI